MSGNTVTAKYIADTSQMEIANDKLTAQNEKLARQVSVLTSKASGFNKTYGNSWNAVRARVEQYTKAVKDATNLRDWYAAVEKLQEASAQFKVIEGNLKGVVAGESAAVVQVVRLENSYTALKEAIDRTKKARDGSIAGSSEYNVLTDKLMKLEQAYDRVAAANKRAAGGQGAKMSADAAKQALYKHRSPDEIKKDIGFWQDEEKYYRRNGQDEYFTRYADQAAEKVKKYREELQKAQQAEAAFKKKSSSSGGTFRKVSANSEEGLQNQIGFLEKKRSAMGPGAEFDKLNGIIAKLQVRLKAVKDDAKKAGEALSEAATAPIGSFKRVEYELKKAKDQLELLTYGTKEYIQQSKKVDSIAAEYRKLDKDINKVVKAQKDSGGLMGTITGQAKTLVMTYVGMHEVVSQITQEWEKQRQIQLDIAERGLGVEGALIQQAANIGVENIPVVKEFARNNQVDLLGSQKDIVTLVGSAVSGGAAEINDAMKVTAAAMRMNVGNVEMANEMLQGGITIGRLNNSNDFEAAFGQLRSSSKASQAVNEAEFISNVLGKAAALTRGRKNMDGMTTERSLEFITAASRIQVDRTGDTSSTNMASIFQRMDEFVPELKKTLKDKTVSKVDPATIAAFVGSRSFDEKLRMLQTNEQLGNQFIDKQKTGGPKELAFALIQNSQATAQIMRESADAVVSFADGAKVFQQAVTQAKDMVPNLVAAQKIAAGGEKAMSGDLTVLNASARKAWETVWSGGTDTNGNKVSALNLSGWDNAKWALAEAEFMASKAGGATRTGLGRPLNDPELMRIQLEKLLQSERRAGNVPNADALRIQIEVLQDIANKMEELNGMVRDRPAAPAVNRAPALPRPAARQPAVN
jgi:hypothetical protein